MFRASRNFLFGRKCRRIVRTKFKLPLDRGRRRFQKYQTQVFLFFPTNPPTPSHLFDYSIWEHRHFKLLVKSQGMQRGPPKPYYPYSPPYKTATSVTNHLFIFYSSHINSNTDFCLPIFSVEHCLDQMIYRVKEIPISAPLVSVPWQ